MTTDFQLPARRVTATMYKATSKEVTMKRSYSYFDTAMPRMLQLAITNCNEGDFIEFTSIEFGWSLGVLRILPKGRFEMEMSDLVKANPSLLKLMNEMPEQTNALVQQALDRAKKKR